MDCEQIEVKSRHHFQDSRGVFNEHTCDDVTLSGSGRKPSIWCLRSLNFATTWWIWADFRDTRYSVSPTKGGHHLYDHLERLLKSWLMISLLFICRANWPVRANCCSRRPSLWQSRTPASCPAPKSGGSSSLSRSSFSASCWGKGRPLRDTSSRRALRYAPEYSRISVLHETPVFQRC